MKVKEITAITAIHLIFLLYLMISAFFVHHLGDSIVVVRYSQIILFVTFFLVLTFQIRLNGLMHLFTIFLALFFLFLLCSPFFDLIGLIDITKEELFIYNKLSNHIYIVVYTYSSLVLGFLFLGVLWACRDNEKIKKIPDIDYRPYLFTVGVIMFCLAFPGIVTKYYLQFKVVFKMGYLAVHNGALEQINYPLICHGSGTLLLIAYCIIISSKPSKKQYLIITAIFLLTQIMNVLKGQRAVLMFPFVFAVWFYVKFYVEKIPKTKLILVVMCVIIFSQVIGIYRSRNDLNFAKKSFTEKYLTSFFVQQGISFFVFPYMLHYKLQNNQYPYIFAPLFVKSFGMPQGMERYERFNYLPDKLMYRMDPQRYKSGLGTGTSLIAEFYDLPYLFAFISCFLLGFAIVRIEMFVKKSRILLLFSYYLVLSVLTSPRFELLQLFYDSIMLGIMFLIVNLLPKLTYKSNDKKIEKDIIY